LYVHSNGYLKAQTSGVEPEGIVDSAKLLRPEPLPSA
jgi:hypothetical protein